MWAAAGSGFKFFCKPWAGRAQFSLGTQSRTRLLHSWVGFQHNSMCVFRFLCISALGVSLEVAF